MHDNHPSHRLSLDRIARAAASIAPEFRHSPLVEHEALSQALGAPLLLKLETLNPIRSFKGRGADFFVRERRAQLQGRTLVCASAGNWGQALAYVCRREGWPLVVFAADSVNPLKAARMRALGAELRLHGASFDAAKQAAREFAARIGGCFVEDGREPEIAEGAGSIAVELLADGRPFDTLLVPLGDGALITGIGRWLKAHAPRVQVIGVCAQGADAMAASWRAGRRVEREAVDTIADGIAVRAPVAEAVADLAGTVDDIVLVDDDTIRRAMAMTFRHAGLLTEAAGAAGVAAVLAHGATHPALRGQRLATVLTGSHATPAQLRALCADEETPR